MTDAVVVFVTTPSEDEANLIAKGLVEARLAACVTLVPAVRSIYRWKGEICDDRETMLIAKTRQECLDRLTDWVRSRHSNEVPEIIAVPVDSGYRPYLDWIVDSLREEDAG